jgi:excisionase family DNA binding protein
MEKLLRIESAAELLGISPWTIRSWIAQGRIRSLKVGSRRLIQEMEIKRLVSEGTAAADLHGPLKRTEKTQDKKQR